MRHQEPEASNRWRERGESSKYKLKTTQRSSWKQKPVRVSHFIYCDLKLPSFVFNCYGGRGRGVAFSFNNLFFFTVFSGNPNDPIDKRRLVWESRCTAITAFVSWKLTTNVILFVYKLWSTVCFKSSSAPWWQQTKASETLLIILDDFMAVLWEFD